MSKNEYFNRKEEKKGKKNWNLIYDITKIIYIN